MAQSMTLGRRFKVGTVFAALLALVVTGCSGGTDSNSSNAGSGSNTGTTPAPVQEEIKGPITIYSGRNEQLMGATFEAFTKATGIEVNIKYGSTPELAATLLEEGSRSPADIYLAQDAGSLSAVAKAGLFATLPDELLNKVEPRFRATGGEWVGLTGRARVVTYNVDKIDPATLPETIWGFTQPEWKGRVGWAPTNASFQSFVSAMRVVEGDAKTKEWLEAMVANDAVVFSGNGPGVQAVADGEVDVFLTNHYYLHNFLAQHGEGFKARNHHLTGGDVGAMINVSGAAVLKSSQNQAAALKLIEFLLGEEAQRMHAEGGNEYPLIDGINMPIQLTPLDQIKFPAMNLNDLHDLDGTLQLLRDAGAL